MVLFGMGIWTLIMIIAGTTIIGTVFVLNKVYEPETNICKTAVIIAVIIALGIILEWKQMFDAVSF